MKIINFFIWICLISVFMSCSQTENKPVKTYNCGNVINPINIENFNITKHYDANSYGTDRLYLNPPSYYFRLSRKVKSIKETVSNISIKFDEEVEEKLTSTIYEFDDNNHLKRKQVTFIGNTINYTSGIDGEYSINQKYLYSKSNQLLYKEISENSEVSKQNYDRSEQYKYFYDDKNQLIKEVYTNCAAFDYREPLCDSTVIKYQYFDGYSSYEAILYDKEGKRNTKLSFDYNKVKNILIIHSSEILDSFSAQNDPNGGQPDSEIIFYFNENCTVKKVTKVEITGYPEKGFHNYYADIEINNQGDITLVSSCNIDGLKKYNLKHYDEFEESQRLDLIGHMDDFIYERFEYEYDNFNNWVKKKTEDQIIRREIEYR